MSAMALNLKRMAKAIFSAIYMDKMWAENMISQPIFYLCQQVQLLTLPRELRFFQLVLHLLIKRKQRGLRQRDT